MALAAGVVGEPDDAALVVALDPHHIASAAALRFGSLVPVHHSQDAYFDFASSNDCLRRVDAGLGPRPGLGMPLALIPTQYRYTFDSCLRI